MTAAPQAMSRGYRPALCRCGHPEGDHKSSRSSFPHPPQYGICLAADCDCRGFTEVCRWCGGSGEVNPPLALPGAVLVAGATCPDCKGTGEAR